MAAPRKYKPPYEGVCEVCSKSFTSKMKRRYCSTKCIKVRFQRAYYNLNSEQINAKKKENRAAKEKRVSERDQWREKFIALSLQVHTRNCEEKAQRILLAVDRVKNSLVSRSKKAGVECDVTISQLRAFYLDHYGKFCRYCSKRKLVIGALTVDHIVPVSKGGSSTLSNLQMICRTCNGVKGSLDEAHYLALMAWLETQPEELRKDVTIRLARGVC